MGRGQGRMTSRGQGRMPSRAEPAASPRGPAGPPGALRRLGHGPLVALAFLTIVPVPPRLLRGADFQLGRAAAWFPLVGGAVGAAAGGVAVGLRPAFGAAPSAVLAVTVAVMLTGALHQDGLADSADAVGVRSGRERRLEVMRDSTVGAFGVLALVLWGLLLVSALSGLTGVQDLRALVAAGCAARLAILVHRLCAPPARRDGLGAALSVGAGALAPALLLSLAICVAAAGPARGLLALGIGIALGAGSGGIARRGLGGCTGDTLGAAAALAEVGVCLGLLASWR
jgi:adenosylcobinamide-GDP ribazoletransferase